MIVSLILDTGERALWSPAKRKRLGRCRRCEFHVDTQGHHDDCPEVAP